MKKNDQEKPKIQYGVDFFEINVCRDKNLLPYLNVFHFEGSNYTEQQLGEVYGVIRVNDYSKTSEYLPNLLAQVFKKEFFSLPERGTESSFESALHKANLALVDLAQHEILGWMSHLQAVIGVVCKNKFHFTQAGGGRILLIRNRLITDISRGLDDGEGHGHPLKTFSNISSGKLEAEDKVIFASETVLDAMNWEEMKRHIRTFKSEEFDNIFRSTLELEGDSAGSVVLNFHQRIISVPSPTSIGKRSRTNFFGSDHAETPSSSALLQVLNDESRDKNDRDNQKSSLTAPVSLQQTGSMVTSSTLRDDQSESQPQTAIINKKNSSDGPPPSEHPHQPIDTPPAKTPSIILSPFESEPEPYIKEDDPEINHALSQHQQQHTVSKRIGQSTNRVQSWLKKRLSKIHNLLIQAAGSVSGFSGKLVDKTKILVKMIKHFGRLRHQHNQEILGQPDTKEDESPSPAVVTAKVIPISGSDLVKFRPIWVDFFRDYRRKGTSIFRQRTKKVIGSCLDYFSHFSAHRFFAATAVKIGRVRRIWIVLAILLCGLLVTVSLLFLKRHANEQTKTSSTSDDRGETILQDTSRPAPDQSAKLLQGMESILTLNTEPQEIVGLHDEIFVLSSSKLTRINPKSNESKDISIPSDIKDIRTIVPMAPLQLLFLITPNSVYSYSPVTERFDSNTIALPTNFDLCCADSYLTYLYLIDAKKKQLYQYPRAAGGFGQQKIWFRDAPPEDVTKSVSINGSVYLLSADGSLQKWFRGREDQTFRLPGNIHDFQTSAIQADEKTEQIFLLDSLRGQLMRLKNDGALLDIWKHQDFISAIDFWIDFQRQEVYVLKKDGTLVRSHYP